MHLFLILDWNMMKRYENFVRNKVKVLRDQIKDDMNSVMDERGVGGN